MYLQLIPNQCCFSFQTLPSCHHDSLTANANIKKVKDLRKKQFKTFVCFQGLCLSWLVGLSMCQQSPQPINLELLLADARVQQPQTSNNQQTDIGQLLSQAAVSDSSFTQGESINFNSLWASVAGKFRSICILLTIDRISFVKSNQ